MSPELLERVCDIRVQEPPSAEEGQLALRALVDAVQAAEPDARAEALSGWCQQARNLDAAAVAWRCSAVQAKAALAPLRKHRGLPGLVDALERDLKAHAPTPPPAPPRPAPAPDERDLASTLEHPGLPPGLRCPPGWALSPEGLFRNQHGAEGGNPTRVAPAPLLVTEILEDIQTRTLRLRVSWASPAGWGEHVLGRKEALNARDVVALAAYGAPVTSDNAPQVVRFLLEFEALNLAELPRRRTAPQMGWQGEGADLCFLWGRAVISTGRPAVPLSAVRGPGPGPALELHAQDPGVGGLIGGFRARGTREGWQQALEAALPYPALFLGVYAALVPPLMRFIPTANFILDFCGETSRGKTTALRLAASVWGDPDERSGGIIASWDTTRVYVERVAALSNHLPTFLDDTKRARRAEDVGRTLYDFANGTGRGRGSLQGVQDTTRHRGVLISTGEAPATSFTNDGGTRARTLCQWGSPFGAANAQTAEAAQRIHQLVLEHHGHAGPWMVHALLTDPGAQEAVQENHRQRREFWTARAAGNPVAGRLANYLAAMDTAAQVLHEVMGLPRPAACPLELAWQSAVRSSQDSDRAADALRDVLGWAAGQQHRFYRRGEPAHQVGDTPTGGWLGAWQGGESWEQLAVLPNELRGQLQRWGYDPEAVLSTWADRGWLRTEGTHRTRKVTVGATSTRCVVLVSAAREAVEAAGHAG